MVLLHLRWLIIHYPNHLYYPLIQAVFSFMNSIRSLKPFGTVLIGTPSLASQVHASQRSKEGHVNCKTGEDLIETCKRHFENVYLFGMNDEVLHTGHSEMCHYYFTLCVNPKKV